MAKGIRVSDEQRTVIANQAADHSAPDGASAALKGAVCAIDPATGKTFEYLLCTLFHASFPHRIPG